jgi:replicative DNA helicase
VSAKTGQAQADPLSEPRLERVVLGAILVSPEQAVLLVDVLRANLTSDDFTAPAHAHVFSAMLRIASVGQRPDLISVPDELKRMGKLEASGGASFVAELLHAVPEALQVTLTVERLAEWCERLKERTQRRLVHAIGRELQEAARRLEAPIIETVGTGTSRLARVRSNSAGIRTLRQYAEQVKRELEARDDGASAPLIRTGLRRLDEATGGGLPYNLTLIAAMGGVGKSGLAATIACRVGAGASRGDTTTEAPRRAAIISAEDPAVDASYRMLAGGSGIHSGKLMFGRLSAEDWSRFGSAIDHVDHDEYGANVIIVDRQRPTGADVVQLVRELVVVHECKLVIIDNATAVRFPKAREERKTEALEEWLGDLRAIATTHGAAVVSMHHVKRREGLAQKDIPLITDIKDTSAAENLGRLVLLCARAPDSNLFRMAVAKQTKGPAGHVLDFYFDMATQLVRDRTPRDETENTPEGYPVGSERAKANARRPRRKKGEDFTTEPEKEEPGEAA